MKGIRKFLETAFPTFVKPKKDSVEKKDLKETESQEFELEESLVIKKKSDGSTKRKADAKKSHFRRREDFPMSFNVISGSQGSYPLSSEDQNNYVIISEGDRDCVIVSNDEFSDRLDNKYIEFKNDLVLKGYTVSRRYAQLQLIKIIYDEAATTDSDISEEDKKGLTSSFDNLVAEALKENVSDIHFECRRTSASVRFRINGDLKKMHDWTNDYATDMVRVIYQVLAEEKDPTFIANKQQSARIVRTFAGVRLGLRLNTLPAGNEEFDAVIRVLKLDDESSADKDISDLDYSDEQVEALRRAMSKPTGVIIVAGTTGSGKSTTLSTLINTRIREHTVDGDLKIKVITVEDPTEYKIYGATQHGVVRNQNDPEDKNPFADAIKAAMRCDPDDLMVGEVRDKHSATLMVGAVQSGHKSYTTIHAPSAIGVIPRLTSFGVDPEVIGSSDFLLAIIYQTLVGKTCPSCSIPIQEYAKLIKHESSKVIPGSQEDKDLQASKDIMKRIQTGLVSNRNLDISKIRFRKDSSFDHECSNPKCRDGLIGRTVVAEVIRPDQLILSAFEKGSVNLAKYYHLKLGGKLILDHAVEKVVNGLIDPRDAESAVDLLDSTISLELMEQSLGLTREQITSIEEEIARRKGLDIEDDVDDFIDRISNGIYEKNKAPENKGSNIASLYDEADTKI